MATQQDRLTRFSNYHPLTDRLMLGLGLLGILVVVHLSIMQGRGFDRGCFGFSAPVETVECEAVLQSDAGTLFGVSNVVWGLLFYVGLTVLNLALPYVSKPMLTRLKQARAAMLSVGLLYSAYLVYVQATQLGEYCKLCLMSAGIVLLLFLTLMYQLFSPETPGMTPTKTLRETPLFATLAVLTALIVVADVAYFNSLPEAEAAVAEAAADPAPAQPVAEEAAPQEAGGLVCPYDDRIAPVEDYDQFINFTTPYKGNIDADVTVIEFFDPNCPHCRTLHPHMKILSNTHAERARFFFIPFVLWEHSLIQSEALHVAATEGKFFEMLDAQFEQQRQGGLSLAQLQAIATSLGMDAQDMTDRLQRGVFRQNVMEDRQKIIEAGIRGAPAVMINGRIAADRSPQCLNQLIMEAAGTPAE